MSFHILKTSGSSLKNIQFGIDAVSHNIANINTTGFKKQQVNYEAVVNSSNRLGEGLSGTALNATTTVFSQGDIKPTGTFTDLAIQKEGFFSLQNSAGEIVYSRAGHFITDSNRTMVDPSGNFLMSINGDRITIPANVQEVEISVNGEVNVAFDDITGFQPYDQIQLATFINPTGLEHIGGNNYRESVASGSPNFSTAGQAGSQTSQTGIVSGALEFSNTNLSESLTDLMAYQRSYQAISRTTTTADEVLQTTINLGN